MDKNNRKKLVTWCFLNGILLLLLFLGVFRDTHWAFNVVGFAVCANFIIWLLIFLGGEKVWRKNRDIGFPVSAYLNGAYGIFFVCVLAASGHFWYAGMETTTTILQNMIHFSDIDFNN